MSEWVITSSILILLIIGIRSCFGNKIALWARYALWLVVALRLLIPLSFWESSLSVLNLLKWETVSTGRTGTLAEGAGNTANTGKNAQETGLSGTAGESYNHETYSGNVADVRDSNGISGAAASGMAGVSGEKDAESGTEGSDVPSEADGSVVHNVWFDTGLADTPFETDKFSSIQKKEQHTEGMHIRWKIVFFCIWLAGAVVIAGIVLSINISYRRRIYSSRARYRTRVRSLLPVYITPAVVTPCMFGLLHPAVYLTPGIEGNEKAFRYVLCHENTHYRHHDNIWALIRAVCVCLHWYNPLVWIAAELSRQDCELACDEKTLKLLKEEDRIDYGRTLLDFSIQSDALPGGLQLSTAVAGGKKQLKERLMMIVGRPRRPVSAMALTMALVLLVSALTFTGKVSGKGLVKEPSEEEPEIVGLGDGAAAVGGNMAGGSERMGKGQNSVSNTSIVTVNLNDGKDYTLKTVWEDAENGDEYRIGQIELNWIHDKMEETVQVIRLEDVKVLYTISLEHIRQNGGQMWSYSPEEEALYAKSLCTAEDLPNYAVESFLAEGSGASLAELCDGSILVEDLNFDGYQDFCLRGRGDGKNIPYYSYLWNPEEGQYEPGYMIPNIRMDKDGELIESATIDGDGVYSTKYYRFDEEYILHMVRYVEENNSQDAVLPALDLTYCETSYALPAVDEWDYGTRYGGALTERFVGLAKNALAELYEWSGTRIETACFAVSDGGEVIFGNTPGDMDASRTYYFRCYGEQAGFENWIRHMGLATERVVWYSPVTQWNVPERLAQMTDEEVVLWYFERSALTEDESVETIEETYEDTFVVRTAAGNYFEISMQASTREVESIYGPYDDFPEH